MTEWKSEIVTLAHPIPGVGENGSDLVSLTMQELNVDGLEAIEAIGFKNDKTPATLRQMKLAVAAVARVPVEIVGKIHRDDFESVTIAAIPFMEGTLTPNGKDTSNETNAMSGSQT